MELDTKDLLFEFTSFTSALQSAKELNKLLLVYVTSDGCGPCLKMKKEIFTNSKVINFFNKKMICGKIHIKRTKSVMKSSEFESLNKTQIAFLEFHNVELAFPTFLVFDNHGNLIHKTTKYMNPNEFIEFGNKILEINNI
ncbi:thioredoxin family protein [Thalassobellus citreus]|uniref:thioredoxin family protein n=1 Tax=Thalassobellus citreus TaxID=3367752 RepID=UPI003793D2B7